MTNCVRRLIELHLSL